MAPIAVNGPGVAGSVSIGDAQAISPALHCWIEHLIDTRVGDAQRDAAASSSNHIQRLESQVRDLSKTRTHLLTIVEQTRAETSNSVDRLMVSVSELQRFVEQGALDVREELRHHVAALQELWTSQGDDLSRHRVVLTELEQQQNEMALQLRKASDEQSGAIKFISATREEVGELAQMVQRLELKLSAWCAEARGELLESLDTRLKGVVFREELEGSALEAARDYVESRLQEEVAELQRCMAGDFEACQKGFRENMEELRNHLLAETRTETQALIRGEQNAIAALDDQLWRIDQRLGERIDGLKQQLGRGERFGTVALAAELAARSPTPPPSARSAGSTVAVSGRSPRYAGGGLGQGRGILAGGAGKTT